MTMNPKTPLLIVIAGLWATGIPAQPYSIDWHSINGGSGAGTGGVYSVTGSIGQHDAGSTMSGGSYTVTGGFWSLLATVQTTGAPALKIFHTATNTVVVYWTSPSTDFSLQQNSDPQSPGWITPPESIADNGTNKFIVVTPPSGRRFYRLTSP